MENQITCKCEDCGRIKIFRGQTIDEILKAIDESGWTDAPGRVAAFCPDCSESD